MEDQQGSTVMGYPVFWTHLYHCSALPYTAQNQPTTTNIAAGNCNSKSCKLILLILVSLLIAVGFGTYATIGRLGHELHPLQFEVHSLTVYPFNVSSSQITTNWDITFSVRNPNHGHYLQCDDFKASVFYKDKNIISSRTMELRERYIEKNKWLLKAKDLGVSSLNINRSVAEAMAGDLSSGALSFTLKMNATAWIDPNGNTEKLKVMRVSCEEIMVEFSSISNFIVGTLMPGASKKCAVELADN